MASTVQQQQWAAEATQSAAAAAQQLNFPHLFDFLVSHEGLDFHSDETDEEVRVIEQEGSQLGAEAEEPAAAGAGHVKPQAHTMVRKIVLTHTFRSKLAADMMHALDGEERHSQQQLLPLLHSHREGAPLSVRMAQGLLQRRELAPLYDKERVDPVAATSKKRKASVHGEGDELERDDIVVESVSKNRGQRQASASRASPGETAQARLAIQRRFSQLMLARVCTVHSPPLAPSACGARLLRERTLKLNMPAFARIICIPSAAHLH